MDEQEYLRRADEFLGRIAKWLEEFDPEEVDFTTGDGLVTIEFADGARYVLNRQRAVRQLWMAAGARAWHYNLDPAGEWLDEKDGHQLVTRLAELLSAKLGRTVAPPR